MALLGQYPHKLTNAAIYNTQRGGSGGNHFKLHGNHATSNFSYATNKTFLKQSKSSGYDTSYAYATITFVSCAH